MKVREKISEILSELTGIDTIDLEDGLQEDLGLNSIQMVTLLIMIEDNFNIFLDESDMNPYDLVYVYQVVDMVKKYIKGDDDEENQSLGRALWLVSLQR